MANYLRPGVYIEEKRFGNPPVSGGATSIGAFIGFSRRGVPFEPTLITSWTDFVNKTALGTESPFMKNSYLAYSVYGFFNNGGQSLYFVRVTDGTEEIATVTVENASGDINISAKDAGEWGNDISVVFSQGDSPSLFNVTVLIKNEPFETHRNLSFGTENNIVGVINQNSKLINIDTDATTIDSLILNTPHKLQGGKDGLENIQDTHIINAIKALDSVPTINLLVIPESQSLSVSQEAVAYAEKRKDCVFIADAGMNDTFESVQTFKEKFNSEFMGLYFPWIEVNDPIGTISRTKYVPVAGHVAGVIARIDTERGVFKAPAGVEASIRGALGVKERINDAQHDVLNPRGINVIRAFPDTGIVIWGARTTANTYLNVRRELNYIQNAILNSTRWAVFEPNNENLWIRIRNQVSDFLRGRYALGAYKGESEEEAFFVKCDAELNPPSEVNAGRVNTEVGVSINKPGEFVIFRIGQWEGGGEVS